MKNYKKKIKYISIFIIITIIQLFLPLDLDEIWNYGFANNIANGLIPYKDFNMILTPFFPFLYSIAIYIFGSNIIIMHIQHALIITIAFYLLDKMYGESSNFFIILMFCFYNCIYPSYNSFLIVLTIILIYLEKNKKNDYLIGILLGIMILTKQSVGICMFLSSTLCYRKEYKKVIKRLIGLTIPITFFVIYLFVTKSYNEFIDLCILGLFDFGKENRFDFNIIYILFILSTFALLYMIKKDSTNINYWYSLGFLSIVIPMFDIIHFLYFTIIFLTLILIPKIRIKKINFSLITFSSIIGITIFVFLQCYIEEDSFYYPNKVKHFEYKYISKEHEKKIDKILKIYKKYSDKNIVFISRSSYFYKIVGDKNINYLDLINKGNWGYNGSSKLIKKIKDTEDSLFVLDTLSFQKNQQSDLIALEYIKENYEKIEELDEFELYINKNRINKK